MGPRKQQEQQVLGPTLQEESMTGSKDRIAVLESGFGLMQDEMIQMREAMNDKFKFMEESFSRLMEAVSNNRDDGTSHRREHRHDTSVHQGDNTNPIAPPQPPQNRRQVKLDFPKYQGGDPTSWISKAKQYFAYQDMPNDQRVSFASYHLEDEANEWWQATAKALGEERVRITWAVFEEELWARFGPTGAEDFDEALSKIKQTGSLRDYHREFERLQNKVTGWTQKALVGTYVGGLKESISDDIRMFKPTTLKATIELARMKDDQLQRTRKFLNSSPASRITAAPLAQTPKKLTFDDMKTKRSLGLCFSCDEKYTPGHRCKQSQLLLMMGEDETDEEDDEFDSSQPKQSFRYFNLEDKVTFGDGSNDASTSTVGPRGNAKKTSQAH